MLRSFSLVFSLLLITSSAFAGVVRGTVTDPDGRPTPGARIVVRGTLAAAAETTTDAQGRFETPNVPDGAYDLHVILDGFSADVQRVEAAASSPDVAVRLRLSALAESVVVSGAQTDLPLSQAASTISVITGTEIAARQLRTPGDALAYVPGLSVARNGSAGTTTSVFTRGGESDFTLVLLDGIRVNSFGGGVDLSAIPLVDVERIEIVRGPQSA
ncbi:MAG: TonB-dependent receptor plug domain-containing protein, partial [Vicinamibacterales bacterium]